RQGLGYNTVELVLGVRFEPGPAADFHPVVGDDLVVGDGRQLPGHRSEDTDLVTPPGDKRMLVEFLPEGFGLVLLGLWLYCIFDVISTDESLARNLPKTMWLLIVIFLPDVGSLAWLMLGRPLYAGWRPGDTTVRQPRAARGPEDHPGWA